MEKKFVTELADFNKDLSKWYTDVILKADLVDYGPVKGTMVIKPYGFEIWENIRNYLDKKFKAVGVKNAYFPMLIPESFIKKEAKHVEGFAPEVAVVTYAGGEELAEKLIIRPTSETIICEMYAKWIKSYRDLPMVMNQWCNVVRWEKTTRPFLRTSEFLWQEGHTVQASLDDAEKDVRKMLDIYVDMAKNLLAIPVLSGEKSERERFAGAQETLGIEAVMPDGKCLQAGTTHNLGQNFAKAAGIKFLNKNGEWEYGYSTSWGVSTRLIGGLIMVHGDERGIKLPPKVAPIQVVIVPIQQNKEGILNKAYEIENILKEKDLRVFVDDSNNTPGWKFNQYEMKGVPLRLEIGPKDIENNVATVVRRDTHEKIQISMNNLCVEITKILDDIQQNMFNKAQNFVNNITFDASNMEELIKIVDDKKVAIAYHCGEEKCEQSIKDETGIQTRVIIEKDCSHKCIKCGKPSAHKIYFARQY